MIPSSLIGHVVELTAAVLTSRHPADSVVRTFLRERRYLGARDRRFISETLFGILRHHRLLTERVRIALAPPSGDPPPSPLVLYAAYALAVAGRPQEEVAADLQTLWSAFLRGRDLTADLSALALADPLAPAGLSAERRLALTHSLPDFVAAEWFDRFGPEAGPLCAALNAPAPTTIRVNALRTTVEECLALLRQEGVECRKAPLAPQGVILGKRVNIPSLTGFRRGWFELQDEGSQLISLLVDPPPGGMVVDACAGGGGKSLHLAVLMENRGRLAAIDRSEQRLGNIRERGERAGSGIISLHRAGEPALASWEGRADAVLVDAPCTGSGTFRRNPGAKLRLTPADRDARVREQRVLLHSYAAMVRPGGRLVYSTCSLLRDENESVVDDFRRSHPDFLPVPTGPLLRARGVEITGCEETLLLLPHRTGTDGFFAAVLERSGP